MVALEVHQIKNSFFFFNYFFYRQNEWSTIPLPVSFWLMQELEMSAGGVLYPKESCTDNYFAKMGFRENCFVQNE